MPEGGWDTHNELWMNDFFSPLFLCRVERGLICDADERGVSEREREGKKEGGVSNPRAGIWQSPGCCGNQLQKNDVDSHAKARFRVHYLLFVQQEHQGVGLLILPDLH